MNVSCCLIDFIGFLFAISSCIVTSVLYSKNIIGHHEFIFYFIISAAIAVGLLIIMCMTGYFHYRRSYTSTQAIAPAPAPIPDPVPFPEQKDNNICICIEANEVEMVCIGKDGKNFAVVMNPCFDY